MKFEINESGRAYGKTRKQFLDIKTVVESGKKATLYGHESHTIAHWLKEVAVSGRYVIEKCNPNESESSFISADVNKYRFSQVPVHVVYIPERIKIDVKSALNNLPHEALMTTPPCCFNQSTGTWHK